MDSYAQRMTHVQEASKRLADWMGVVRGAPSHFGLTPEVLLAEAAQCIENAQSIPLEAGGGS
jgi:hypothetical protein